MNKHTPGPWAIETDHDDPIEDTVLIHGAADCPGMTPVALVYTADAFPCVEDEDRAAFEAECKANATLIASAPTLLTTLKTLVDAVTRARKADDNVYRTAANPSKAVFDEQEDAHATLIIRENAARDAIKAVEQNG